MQLRCFCFGTLALGIVTQSACAIVTSDQVGSHDVVPGQPAFGLDLDGVAIIGRLAASGRTFRACTGALISDSHVLCAAHCFDDDRDGQLESPMAPFEDEVVFQLASGPVAIGYQFQSVQVPADWPDQQDDIAIITLSQNAPPQVPRYPLHGGLDEEGKTAVLAGYGSAGHGSTGEDPGFDTKPTLRAGLNLIEAVLLEDEGDIRIRLLGVDFDSGLPENDLFGLTDGVVDLGLGTDEVGIAPGDSGGPMFVNGAIAGVNIFTLDFGVGDATNQLDRSWGEATFATHVASYRNFILAATGGKAIFVPEPSTLLLLFAGALGAPFLMAKNRC